MTESAINRIAFTKLSPKADWEKRTGKPESQVDSSAITGRFTQSAQRAGKGKVRMNKVDDRERIPMSKEEANELYRFINGKVKYFCKRKGCPYPLSETNLEIVKTHLLHIGVKALERWEESKHGLRLRYVCGMIKLSCRQVAARVYWKQCKRGESRDGDLSLDEKLAAGKDQDTTFLDTLAEDAEAVYGRKLRKAVKEVLKKLCRKERIALKTLMYDDFTQCEAARQIGCSRPTVLAWIDRGLKDFYKIWAERGL